MQSLKILPTIGPISEHEDSIKKILKFTDIVRTNGSHSNIRWHENISNVIKKINPNALHLLDIPGVKPRTGNTKQLKVKKGELILFYFGKKIITKYRKIILTKPLPPINSKIKNFSIADGQYYFNIEEYGKDFVLGKSISNFTLLPYKGLNIPNAIYDNNLQLKHYKSFLRKCKNIDFDVIGLSYIQSDNIIRKIRKLYKDKIIVSKIENKEGLKNVYKIAEESDIIMIDRGDLAAEVGSHNLFDSVLKITKATKENGKPLIMATENLVSMFNKNEPTKSEIMSLGMSSLIDGDVIMLSEETALSKNWLNTIKWLNDYLKKLKSVQLNTNFSYYEKNSSINEVSNNNVDSESIEPSIWSCFNFNSNDNFVFFSRTGASIKEFKKKYKSNTSLVLTDSILTNNLCKFWKDVNGVYLKSLSKFHNVKNIPKIIKTYQKLVFSGKKNRAICLLILNPKNGSKANCIYFIDKKDLI